jgi:hypothetical protein
MRKTLLLGKAALSSQRAWHLYFDLYRMLADCHWLHQKPAASQINTASGSPGWEFGCDRNTVRK